EQFYFAFPLLVAFCGFGNSRRSTGTRNLRSAVVALAAISLATYLFLSRRSPSAAFYLMPARFWELGLGCLTFLAVQRGPTAFSKPKSVLATLSVLSIVGVLFSARDAQNQ